MKHIVATGIAAGCLAVIHTPSSSGSDKPDKRPPSAESFSINRLAWLTGDRPP